ncbi:uncharacterized protein LOC129922752 [Biomphalaria glabrata]|uniref:Uncharacterized protein LOC129922752 n=1 Tax=Biomphalaria glabrata TaxID=6526 RepID=A0A9W2YSF8_BIOGL|nr:uncharacterized protein LOC129922752 [Biomphalaria glabrata]
MDINNDWGNTVHPSIPMALQPMEGFSWLQHIPPFRSLLSLLSPSLSVGLHTIDISHVSALFNTFREEAAAQASTFLSLSILLLSRSPLLAMEMFPLTFGWADS